MKISAVAGNQMQVFGFLVSNPRFPSFPKGRDGSEKKTRKKT